MTEQPYRLLGLSATVGDTDLARRYLDMDHPERVRLVDDKSMPNELRLRIHGYRLPLNTSDDGTDQPAQENAAPPAEVVRAAHDMTRHGTGHANLVFANSKGDVEEFADLCKRLAQEQRLKDQFLVHHGSLSAEIREDAEATMKRGATATTFCSSTLEMGIDIGSVYMVGQIGAPWSVSSMKQRMGRSGRKPGQPRIMRVYIQCHDHRADVGIFDRLHLELVQAVAVTELMLAGWMEPPAPPACDLSTLTQQIISVIVETGGIRADELYGRLCREGAFRDIEPKLFTQLLRVLAARDVIEHMAEGDLILGLKGERLRKDKGFYAVFPTPEEYSVLHNGMLLGTLECAHEKGDHLLFAGRRWRVVEVDPERLELHVQPASGWKRPRFGGAVGEVHPAVCQKMREILASPARHAYLDAAAQGLLEDARHVAASAAITEKVLVALGPKKSAIVTWTGTRIQQTLQAMLAAAGIDTADEHVALVVDLPETHTQQALGRLLTEAYAPQDIARFVPWRRRRKYDQLLTDELLDVTISRGWLDIEGALQLLRNICSR